MISGSTTDALLDTLRYLGEANVTLPATGEFTFDLDFGSARVWPDLPFDSSAADTHYPDASRPAVQAILRATGALYARRAPKALAFVNAQFDQALLRRSGVVHGAASYSNRECVGTCLLANLEAAPDSVHVCVEALVHEGIHQYLYRIEKEHGAFCDLGEHRTYRSPWSGNRIPLHSLVHACFVWFGLLTLWCQIARTPAAGNDASIVRERVGRILFGFTFLRPMLASPAFPIRAVISPVVEMIRGMTDIAIAAGITGAEGATLRDSLRGASEGPWLPRLVASLEPKPAPGTAR